MRKTILLALFAVASVVDADFTATAFGPPAAPLMSHHPKIDVGGNSSDWTCHNNTYAYVDKEFYAYVDNKFFQHNPNAGVGLVQASHCQASCWALQCLAYTYLAD